MSLATLMDTNLYIYLILPLLIFFARIIDVSMGTLRVIFITRGYKIIAPFIGFFEVLIWLLAIGQIMSNLTNVYCYLGYAAGFAAGTFTGIVIEEKLSIGKVIIRIVTKRDAKHLLLELKKSNYSITITNAQGAKGKVKIIFAVINRSDLPPVLEIVKKLNPNAFYSIEDIKYASENHFSSNSRKKLFFLKLRRKNK